MQISPVMKLRAMAAFVLNALRHLKIKKQLAILEDIRLESRLQLSVIIWAYAMTLYNNFRAEGM